GGVGATASSTLTVPVGPTAVTVTAPGGGYSSAVLNPTNGVTFFSAPVVVLTGNTSGTSIANLSPANNLVVGRSVTGAGIPAGTFVTALPSATQATLNNSVTTGTGVTLTFTSIPSVSTTANTSTVTPTILTLPAANPAILQGMLVFAPSNPGLIPA